MTRKKKTKIPTRFQVSPQDAIFSSFLCLPGQVSTRIDRPLQTLSSPACQRRHCRRCSQVAAMGLRMVRGPCCCSPSPSSSSSSPSSSPWMLLQPQLPKHHPQSPCKCLPLESWASSVCKNLHAFLYLIFFRVQESIPLACTRCCDFVCTRGYLTVNALSE